MFIDTWFPISGAEIPADHGYSVFSAASGIVPKIHDNALRVRIGPIRGKYQQSNGLLKLDERTARLPVRMSAENLPLLLPLAGKNLDLGGHVIRLGVPQVSELVPAPNLIARLVVIKASSPRRDATDKHSRDRIATKRYLEPEAFLDAVRRDLQRRGIGAQADLPIHQSGPRAGEPRRHVLRIHGKTIVGYSVLVQGLTAAESICLQEEGVGGRAKMGGSFFVVFQPRG